MTTHAKQQPTVEEVTGTLRACLPQLSERYGVHALGLFGSYLRGEQGRPSDLDGETQMEMLALVNHAVEALQEAMRPDGFNIGVNLGTAAGAGIGEHLHVHIVPRWSGDTNFMTIFAETRVVPEMLEDTYDKLKRALDGIMARRSEP